jgi:hypothetical protein
VVREELRYVHTSLIGKVSVVNDDYTVDVQPLVKRAVVKADNSGIIYRELPILPSVPVASGRSGKAEVYMRLEQGDLVEVRFSMFSMEELLNTDQSDPIEPQDHRMHALEDAVAFPVMLGNAPADINNSDYAIISEKVVLGSDPKSAETLVMDGGESDGLQEQLNTFAAGVKSYIDSGKSADTGTGSPVSVTYSATFPSNPAVKTTDDTKAS